MIPYRDKDGQLHYKEIKEFSPGQLTQVWLMSSYLYYEKNLNVIDDITFDLISRVLLDNFDSFEHPHKYILDKESLEAGTGAFIREVRYPKMVRLASQSWYEHIIEGKHLIQKTVRKTIRKKIIRQTGLMY